MLKSAGLRRSGVVIHGAPGSAGPRRSQNPEARAASTPGSPGAEASGEVAKRRRRGGRERGDGLGPRRLPHQVVAPGRVDRGVEPQPPQRRAAGERELVPRGAHPLGEGPPEPSHHLRHRGHRERPAATIVVCDPDCGAVDARPRPRPRAVRPDPLVEEEHPRSVPRPAPRAGAPRALQSQLMLAPPPLLPAGAAALVLACALGACGGPALQARAAAALDRHLPAPLEAPRPRDGEPRAVTLRVYADAAVRAQPRWREEITDQIDYAGQLLTPLLGIRVQVDRVVEWERSGGASAALTELAALDPGADVTWVVGYIGPGERASRALSELALAEPLGRHAVVRAWATAAETAALAAPLAELPAEPRAEVIAAHRRHKQTVVLLRALATTLGAIAEADPAWLQHPTYSPKMAGFSERNRELMALAIADRLGGGTAETAARKLLAAIERTSWGGFVAADQEQLAGRLRAVLDAARAGKAAAAVPPAAYAQYARIEELAKRGQPADALAELDNLLIAYPGNAAMLQLRCDIHLRAPGVAAPATRAACARAAAAAPGDPAPHLAVAEALARAGDRAGARAELLLAEARLATLTEAAPAGWRRAVAIYQGLGALTWTEDAISRGGLAGDPAAARAAQTRARYGVPRGGSLPPEQEPALVAAVRAALDRIYAGALADAERELDAAERTWPGAAGLAAARCDLRLRAGQLAAARAQCNRALAADPRASWALYLSGVIALRDPSPAATRAGIDLLRRAIAVDPELGQAWRTLAKAYARAADRAALDRLGQDYAAQFGQALPR